MAVRGDLCDCSIIHEDTVAEAKEALPNEGYLNALTDFFKVFGDTSRVKILLALEVHEMCVCDLAVLLNVTKSAVSHQLRALKENGLVKFRREGKIVYYSLLNPHISIILKQGLDYLSELEERN